MVTLSILALVVKAGKYLLRMVSSPSHPIDHFIAATGQLACRATTISARSWFVADSVRDSNMLVLADDRVQDGCNIEGENGKQGGFYDDACASYRILFVDH